MTGVQTCALPISRLKSAKGQARAANNERNTTVRPRRGSVFRVFLKSCRQRIPGGSRTPRDLGLRGRRRDPHASSRSVSSPHSATRCSPRDEGHCRNRETVVRLKHKPRIHCSCSPGGGGSWSFLRILPSRPSVFAARRSDSNSDSNRERNLRPA